MKKRLILYTALLLISCQLCFSQTYSVRLEELAAVKYQSLSSPNNQSIQHFNKSTSGKLSILKKNSDSTLLSYQLTESLANNYSDSLIQGNLLIISSKNSVQIIHSSREQLQQSLLLVVSRLLPLNPALPNTIKIQQQDGILELSGTYDSLKKEFKYTSGSIQNNNATKIRVNFLQLNWSIKFEGSALSSFASNETFDQFLGAKQLAAVHRELSIKQIQDTAEFHNAQTPYTIIPFKTISEEDRRILINQSIAKNLELNTLIKELYQTNLNNSEQAFRLKSKWRAFLILNPSQTGIDSIYHSSKTDPRKRTVLITAILEASTAFSRKLFLASLSNPAASFDEKEEWLTTCSQVAQPDSVLITDLKNATAQLPLELKNTCWLTVSNLIQKLSSKNNECYHFFAKQVANELLTIDRFQKDTVAYMQIMGNMGYVQDWKMFEAFYESNKDEAIFCLRHCQQESSNQFLIRYITDSSCKDELIASYFQNHEISPKIYTLIYDRITTLDHLKNTGSTKLLNLILEKRWTSQLNIETLLKHNFEMKENGELITAYLKGLFNYRS